MGKAVEEDAMSMAELLGYIFIGICLVLFVVVPVARLLEAFSRWLCRDSDEKDDWRRYL